MIHWIYRFPSMPEYGHEVSEWNRDYITILHIEKWGCQCFSPIHLSSCYLIGLYNLKRDWIILLLWKPVTIIQDLQRQTFESTTWRDQCTTICFNRNFAFNNLCPHKLAWSFKMTRYLRNICIINTRDLIIINWRISLVIQWLRLYTPRGPGYNNWSENQIK